MARRLHLCRPVVVLATLAAIVLPREPAAGDDRVTVAALRITYERECNARLQYEAFAARAERDHQPLAALAFRAAAIAESIHAVQQAGHLRQLGAEPTWTASRVVVRGTSDNLCQAITNEVYENQYIYRQIVDQSRVEGVHEVLTAFAHARAAEATHAGLFAAVLQELESIEAPVARVTGPEGEAETVYHVCLSDGSVFTHPICGSCPNCGGSQDGFRGVAVSHAHVRAALTAPPPYLQRRIPVSRPTDLRKE